MGFRSYNCKWVHIHFLTRANFQYNILLSPKATNQHSIVVLVNLVIIFLLLYSILYDFMIIINYIIENKISTIIYIILYLIYNNNMINSIGTCVLEYIRIT